MSVSVSIVQFPCPLSNVYEHVNVHDHNHVMCCLPPHLYVLAVVTKVTKSQLFSKECFEFLRIHYLILNITVPLLVASYPFFLYSVIVNGYFFLVNSELRNGVAK